MSSDALVHLKMSTEYLGKSCRTAGCLAKETKISSRGQSTTARIVNAKVQVPWKGIWMRKPSFVSTQAYTIYTIYIHNIPVYNGA